MLPPDDLGWLDESIRRSDENDDDDDEGDGDGDDGDGDGGDGGNDEETHGIGGNQRGGAMTWDSKYYTTQDTDHRGRAGISQQRRYLNRLVDLSSSDDC